MSPCEVCSPGPEGVGPCPEYGSSDTGSQMTRLEGANSVLRQTLVQLEAHLAESRAARAADAAALEQARAELQIKHAETQALRRDVIRHLNELADLRERAAKVAEDSWHGSSPKTIAAAIRALELK